MLVVKSLKWIGQGGQWDVVVQEKARIESRDLGFVTYRGQLNLHGKHAQNGLELTKGQREQGEEGA